LFGVWEEDTLAIFVHVVVSGALIENGITIKDGVRMTKQIRNTSGNGASPRLDPRSSEFTAEFKRAAKAFSAKTTRSPKKARAALVEMGILTPSGKLSKNYR
jgi:hypothetical protein